jgi:BirA family biotin operon repressor/biotin-[acetyl-CoA-carboxylase] ligase
LLGGAKLGGILVEATQVSGALVTVIGFGLNISHAPYVPGRRTAALAAVASRPGSTAQIAKRVAQNLEALLTQWDDGRGFDDIRAAWLAVAAPVGTAMTVETLQGRVDGAFAGLDREGALLMDVDQDRRRYTYGDVTLASEREMS